MTALAQTALDFCREVLGWQDAYHSGDGYIVSRSRKGSGVWEPRDSASLDRVMAAVRDWCDQNDGSVELAYYGYVPGEWEASIASPVSTATIVHPDPCQALMAACLEAARRLKAA